MSNSNLLSIQGVNEHISNLIVSTALDQQYIADVALPLIPTRSADVTYRKFGNDHLADLGAIDTLRAPGAMPNHVDTRWSTGSSVLREHMVGCSVDIQEIAAGEASGPGGADDVRLAKLSTARAAVLIAKESEVADLVFASANYGSLTSSSVDFAATGIRKVFMEAMDSVIKATGVRPNKLILGATSAIELLNNADLLSAFQNGGLSQAATMADVARFLGVDEVHVASAVTQTSAAAGVSGTGTYIWTADSAALIAAPSSVSKWVPSFGYLFQGMYGFGGKEFAKIYEQNELVEKWAYGQHFKAAVSGLTAGYLWTNTDQ